MFLPTSELTGHFQSRLTVGFLTALPRRNRREKQVSPSLKEERAEFSCYPVSRCECLARQHRDRAPCPAREGEAAGGTRVGINLGDKKHIPTATEASLLHVAVLLHYSALHFYLQFIGLCIYMNKPLHNS